MEDIIQFIPDECLIATDVFYELSETVDWGLQACHVPDAWKYSQGEGVTVAVIDTGGPDHIDINDNIIARYDVTGDGPHDAGSYHSTHVCGIIAALQNDIGIVGVAPKTKIITIKVLDNAGRGSYGNIAKGLELCKTLNVDIINMSLGSQTEPPPEIHNIIAELHAQNKILIAAAGNDAGSVNYPAAYPEVIAVAPVDKFTNVPKFASVGNKVAVASPGVDIFSLGPNNGYKIMSGSSQASPFFSGVTALLLSYSKLYPDKLTIKNTEDVLKLLIKLCTIKPANAAEAKLAAFKFGIPDFANQTEWNNE